MYSAMYRRQAIKLTHSMPCLPRGSQKSYLESRLPHVFAARPVRLSGCPARAPALSLDVYIASIRSPQAQTRPIRHETAKTTGFHKC
jgi:hypothetical protein